MTYPLLPSSRRNQEGVCAFSTTLPPTFGSTASGSATIWLDPSFQVDRRLQVIIPSLDHDQTIGTVTQAQALLWTTSSAANRSRRTDRSATNFSSTKSSWLCLIITSWLACLRRPPKPSGSDHTIDSVLTSTRCSTERHWHRIVQLGGPSF